MNKCKYCSREYIYKKGTGHQKYICRSCKMRLYRKKLKTELVNIYGGKCIICGYHESVEALEFHHRNPLEKKFGVCPSKHHSMKKLVEESKKCNLLCANCHREIHEKLKFNIFQNN